MLDTDTGVRRGVDARAAGGEDNWGVYAWALGQTGSRHNYGILAGVNENGTGDNYAGYFVGNVFATGTIIGNPSDGKLKENVQNLESSIEAIKSLRPVSFQYKREDPEYKDLNLPEGLQVGLLAEEVQLIFPDLIKEQSQILYPSTIITTDENGDNIIEENTEDAKELSFKSINYLQLIPLLVKAIQEQQVEIDELKNTLENR